MKSRCGTEVPLTDWPFMWHVHMVSNLDPFTSQFLRSSSVINTELFETWRVNLIFITTFGHTALISLTKRHKADAISKLKILYFELRFSQIHLPLIQLSPL